MSSLSILAVDLSLTATGYACGSGLSDLDVGTIKTTLRGWERIRFIRKAIMQRARCVDLVIAEGYSFGSPGRLVYAGELGGIIRYELFERGIPFVDVPPATLKKYSTGKGNAKKIDMVVAARERFGFTHSTDDNECDAYLLWAMARQAYGHPIAKVPALQAAVVEKIEWPRLEVAAA